MTYPVTPFRKASFWKNEPFHLVELVASVAPEGTSSSAGYRYVLSRGGDLIEGWRAGSEASVRAAVEEFLVRLNERCVGVPNAWRPASPGRPKAGSPIRSSGED